jgi:hypothetical protein
MPADLAERWEESLRTVSANRGSCDTEDVRAGRA